jgi:flagellar motor switch protein FliN/FliY
MTSLEEIAHLADIRMDVQIELDRKTMLVRDILELGRGDVIRLTRSAGENLDIIIGGALIGYGEVVIIEDVAGLRITDFAAED